MLKIFDSSLLFQFPWACTLLCCCFLFACILTISLHVDLLLSFIIFLFDKAHFAWELFFFFYFHPQTYPFSLDGLKVTSVWPISEVALSLATSASYPMKLFLFFSLNQIMMPSKFLVTMLSLHLLSMKNNLLISDCNSGQLLGVFFPCCFIGWAIRLYLLASSI